MKKKRFPKRKIIVPKACHFCKEGIEPNYAEVAELQKLITGQGKITPPFPKWSLCQTPETLNQ